MLRVPCPLCMVPEECLVPGMLGSPYQGRKDGGEVVSPSSEIPSPFWLAHSQIRLHHPQVVPRLLGFCLGFSAQTCWLWRLGLRVLILSPL